MVMVSTVEDAMQVVKSELDIIVAQGSEAGGHRSTWVKKPSKEYGTLALVSQIVKRIKIPVVAAGGITGGAGTIEPLSLGAEAYYWAHVFCGKRVCCTRMLQTEDHIGKQRQHHCH